MSEIVNPGTGGGGSTPTGPAGGDLGGTYPNPSVEKIHGVAYNADPLVQYLLRAGRPGTTNDAIISSTATGTLSGSAVSGGGLNLLANNVDLTGAIGLLDPTHAFIALNTYGRPAAIFGPVDPSNAFFGVGNVATLVVYNDQVVTGPTPSLFQQSDFDNPNNFMVGFGSIQEGPGIFSVKGRGNSLATVAATQAGDSLFLFTGGGINGNLNVSLNTQFGFEAGPVFANYISTIFVIRSTLLDGTSPQLLGTLEDGMFFVGDRSVIGGASSDRQAFLIPLYPTYIGAVIQAATSQSADLTQWRSAAGAVLASVDKDGNLLAVNAHFTGKLTVDGAIDPTDITYSGQLISTHATGVAPIAVTSTTLNTNLNADMVDGHHATDFVLASAVIDIAHGGTGQTSALAAFNALSPLTTRGDLLTRNATDNVRLAVGAAAKYLRSDGTDPSWQTIAYADISGTPSSLPPSGSAGGDLSGTYPNPTVSKINGVAFNADPLAQYALLAGRSGTANDLTLRTGGGSGTIYGSDNNSGGMVLKANSGTNAGAITMLANSGVVIGNSSLTGILAFAVGAHVSTFTPQTQSVDLNYTLPAAITTNGYLKTASGGGLSWALITAAEITSGAALTKTDDTNVTLTLGGSPTTALLAAASLTLGWTGQLGLSRGGTHADLSATGGTGKVLQQASTGADITVATVTNLPDAVTVGNKFTKYNNITTAGNGIWAIVAQARSTGNTGQNTSVATFTPTADGSFIVSANVLITASSNFSFTVQCTYTDEGNTARTLTMTFSLLAGGATGTTLTNVGGTAPYHGVPVQIRAKANTAITIKTSATTFTSVTYNIEGMITQVA